MANNNFKKGDIVVKKYGKMPLEVTNVSGNYLNLRYVHSGGKEYSYYTKFKFYTEEGTTDMKDAIYEFVEDGETLYGTHVGTKSDGTWLVEVKDGNGIIFAGEKERFTEVTPYTCKIRMNGRTFHSQFEQGSVEVGDILINTADGVDNFRFAMVKELDTKYRGSLKFKGVKLVTEKIG